MALKWSLTKTFWGRMVRDVYKNGTQSKPPSFVQLLAEHSGQHDANTREVTNKASGGTHY